MELSSDHLMNISRVIVDERFTVSPSLRHDIALLKLAGTHSDLPHICIDTDVAEPTDLCYTAGWGSVDGRGNTHNNFIP